MNTQLFAYFGEGKLDESDLGVGINDIEIVHKVHHKLRHRFRILAIHRHFGNIQNLKQQTVQRVLAERRIHQNLADNTLRIHHIVAHRD